MQNVIFEEEEEVVVKRPEKKKEEKTEKESRSEIGKWLERHEFVEDAKSGEYKTIIFAIIIIALAAVIFVYGIGKRQAANLESTGNVYLKNQW
jgi:cbb3-type cytochrome oxidase subunit 3